MRQKFDPDLEFDWGPTLWSAATLVILGLLVNFVVIRPNWLPWAAMIAGGVAAARSEYYDPSANSGAVGVFLGTLILIPVLAIHRVTLRYGFDTSGDTFFLTVGLSLGWLLVVLMVLVPLAYFGAIITDFVRRRIGGPIGY